MEKDDSVVHDNKKTTTITSYRLCNSQPNRKVPISRKIERTNLIPNRTQLENRKRKIQCIYPIAGVIKTGIPIFSLVVVM